MSHSVTRAKRNYPGLVGSGLAPQLQPEATRHAATVPGPHLVPMVRAGKQRVHPLLDRHVGDWNVAMQQNLGDDRTFGRVVLAEHSRQSLYELTEPYARPGQDRRRNFSLLHAGEAPVHDQVALQAHPMSPVAL